MPRIISSQVERLRRAAVRTSDVWQGGIFRMPGWITGEKRRPYRVLVPVWISVETGAAFPGDVMRPEEYDPAGAVDALAEAALRSPIGGYRPGRLEVTDPSLAEYLRDEVSELGIEVSRVERLEQVETFLKAIGEKVAGPIAMRAALDAPGVTVKRMSAFADAAADYYRASLWNHLSNLDLISIESPVPDPLLSHLVVMGMAGEHYGIAFFSSVEQFEALCEADGDPEFLTRGNIWCLDYGPIMEIPFPDADLWEDHGLSLAGPDAYPCFFCRGPSESFHRPDAETLAFGEGLLRALAATTEDELDGGRWTKNAETFDGGNEVTLALPGVLDPRPADTPARRTGFAIRRGMESELRALAQVLEERNPDSPEQIKSLLERELPARRSQEFKAENPKEAALDVIDQALEAEGRLQIKLARQALAIDPDCADAYLLLAESAPDPERRLELYRKGTEAGERTIGKRAFEEDAGRFWGMIDTRPYMRARAGLAGCLRSLGRVAEAIGHYRELLRLNPGDNQGIRLDLIPLLLERGDDAEARVLVDAYPDDISAPIAYARALLAFRKEGDGPEARKELEAAIKINPHMLKFLLGRREIPDYIPSYYSLGSKEEALVYGPDSLPAWENTPGAMAWLKARRKDRKKQAAGKRKRAGKGGARSKRKSKR